MSVCPKCGIHICPICGGELASRNYKIGICSRCQRNEQKR